MAQITECTPVFYKFVDGKMTDEVDYGAMAEQAKLSLENMEDTDTESGGGFLTGFILGLLF